MSQVGLVVRDVPGFSHSHGTMVAPEQKHERHATTVPVTVLWLAGSLPWTLVSRTENPDGGLPVPRTGKVTPF